jgi:hypothetical protein
MPTGQFQEMGLAGSEVLHGKLPGIYLWEPEQGLLEITNNLSLSSLIITRDIR